MRVKGQNSHLLSDYNIELTIMEMSPIAVVIYIILRLQLTPTNRNYDLYSNY